MRVEGNSHTVRFGRVGTEGQTQTKQHPSAEEAIRAAEKLVESKKKKGYRAGGFDVDGLLARIERELPFGPDGQPVAGSAIRYDGGPARLGAHRVRNETLGLTVVRILHLERGDELVAMAGGCAGDGVYFLDHEAGLFTVEELDGDAGVFEGPLAFTDAASWSGMAAAERIALLQSELGFQRVGDPFAQIEVESWEVVPPTRLEVSVELAIEPGQVHAQRLAVFGDAQREAEAQIRRRARHAAEAMVDLLRGTARRSHADGRVGVGSILTRPFCRRSRCCCGSRWQA
ncbi:MAG: WGR domain-containing protein [Myxococcales bacterium]|nr:WGR domain-containing protein [Myxococcales bacterium]MCA9567757.1 WGR domain-containing protein [Myxococcales bacterium]